MSYPHTSVLLEEVIRFFDDRPIRCFVDGTLGAGGHAEAILQHHPEIEVFVGIDQDPVALNLAKKRLAPWSEKITLVRGNFENLEKHLKTLNIQAIDGMLLDLGVSSMQFDMSEKGFSFMRNGPLDMRMDPEGSLSAFEIVNTWSEKELGKIFRDYGEEKQWRAAARVIVEARAEKNIETTHQLAEVLNPIFSWKKKGINPLTLIFQALRIAVNRELSVLEHVLPQAIELLAPGGRLGVISFHSLEDRIAKDIFRFGASDKYDTSGLGGGLFRDKKPTLKILTRKPLSPTDQEMERNPRSRSAKLRFIEKL